MWIQSQYFKYFNPSLFCLTYISKRWMWLLNMFFCAYLLYICLYWGCDTVMTAVPILWQCFLLCLFCSRIVVNIDGICCDCHRSVRFSAIKACSIHHFLHLKIPVPSQENDSCCPFVWCLLSFEFATCLGTFRFEFSSEKNY